MLPRQDEQKVFPVWGPEFTQSSTRLRCRVSGEKQSINISEFIHIPEIVSTCTWIQIAKRYSNTTTVHAETLKISIIDETPK